MDDRSSTLLSILPVCTFGIVASISGLSYSWKTVAAHWHLSTLPFVVADGFSILLFAALTVFFIYEFSRQPRLLRAAIQNPPSPHYFVMFPMTVLFLSAIFWPFNRILTLIIWTAGTALVGVFIFKIAIQWICRPCLLEKMTPAYMLPITVALDVPVTGYYLPFRGIRMICHAFLAVGLLFTLVLSIQLIVSLIRKRQQEDAAGALITFSILTALVYMAYDSYAAKESMFSSVMFYTASGLLLAITLHALYKLKDAAFALSIWTFASPLIIVTVAAMKFALRGNSRSGWIIALILLIISTGVIGILLARVIKQFNNLCREIRIRMTIDSKNFN